MSNFEYETDECVSILTGINANAIPSARSNPFTQMIWTTSEFVGCADARSSQSGRSCSASVCYYSYVSNTFISLSMILNPIFIRS